jgi:DNA ligase-1
VRGKWAHDMTVTEHGVLPTLEHFRPMLSASFPSAKRSVPSDDEVIRDLRRLDWSRGFLCSPKLDGIRAVKHPTFGLVSRTLKPIPNRWIQYALRHPGWDYLDGELVRGSWDDHLTWEYNDNQSAIMSEGGVFEFTYAVFDHVSEPEKAFWYRNGQAAELIGIRGQTIEEDFSIYNDGPKLNCRFHIHHLHQYHARSIDDLLNYEREILAQGFEGVIARDRGCRYKNGRATWNQQGMFKMKRFVDAEAIIIGFEELYRNYNPATKDALGYQVRSDHLAGMLPADTLGYVRVKGATGAFADVEFSIGSGFDDGLRAKIWGNRDGYLGKVVKFKYQQCGAKDKPRAPIFLGFRHTEDL